MFKVRLPVSSAVDRIKGAKIGRVGEEVVDIVNSVGRILAEDVVSEVEVPPMDRSAVDGYAVIAEDTFGASYENPVQLKLIGSLDVRGGSIAVGRGEAVRVATGTPLPKGANAVVMLEFAKEIDGYVEIYKAVTPFENVCRRGEDLRRGEVILKRGEIIQPQDVGVLASIGRRHVRVVKRPKVAVICTGDELVEVSEGEGVVNSNGPMICSSLKDAGCEPVYMGIARDRVDEIRDALLKALKYDAVVVIGGTSVGSRDLVPKVVGEMGDIIFHGVAIKPGMPTGLGVVDGKPVLMLPGFPVACILSFNLFFPEIMAKMTGVRVVARRGERVRVRLLRRIPSSPGVRTFARVKILNGCAEPLRISGSGVLSSLVRGEGMVVVPEEREGYEEGEVVDAILIRDLVERVE